MSELEIREATFEVADEELREVTGLAVPYGQVTTVGSYRERFERGAVKDSEAALLFYGHTEPIGKLVEAEDTEDGWKIRAKISKTPRGDEVMTLLRDGVLTKFSVGFQPIEERNDNGVVVRTNVRVHEVSVVPLPAYAGAEIQEVRASNTNTQENAVTDNVTSADLVEVRESVEDLERRMAVLSTSPAEESAVEYRGIGEFVKAIASGDERAIRAYEGIVSGDSVSTPSFIDRTVRMVQERQRVTNVFSRGTLPATGNHVEFIQLDENTIQVGVQSGEGEDLPFGKVSLTTDTAPVKTLGGWTSLSRQTIERTDANILDTAFNALAIKYAKAVENQVRATVTTLLATAPEVTGTAATADGVVNVLLDLVELYDEKGYALNGLFVSRDVLEDLRAAGKDEALLQISGAPTDKAGTITVTSLSGEVAGIPFYLYPNAPAGTFFAFDSQAIKVLESPGAPVRLQDDNIVNLTRDFSVYGYLAVAPVVPDAITKVTLS